MNEAYVNTHVSVQLFKGLIEDTRFLSKRLNRPMYFRLFIEDFKTGYSLRANLYTQPGDDLYDSLFILGAFAKATNNPGLSYLVTPQ